MTATFHSHHSSSREKVIEHVFLGDLLRQLWLGGVTSAEMLKPEVDDGECTFRIYDNAWLRLTAPATPSPAIVNRCFYRWATGMNGATCYGKREEDDRSVARA